MDKLYILSLVKNPGHLLWNIRYIHAYFSDRIWASSQVYESI